MCLRVVFENRNHFRGNQTHFCANKTNYQRKTTYLRCQVGSSPFEKSSLLLLLSEQTSYHCVVPTAIHHMCVISQVWVLCECQHVAQEAWTSCTRFTYLLLKTPTIALFFSSKALLCEIVIETLKCTYVMTFTSNFKTLLLAITDYKTFLTTNKGRLKLRELSDDWVGRKGNGSCEGVEETWMNTAEGVPQAFLPQSFQKPDTRKLIMVLLLYQVFETNFESAPLTLSHKFGLNDLHSDNLHTAATNQNSN